MIQAIPPSVIASKAYSGVSRVGGAVGSGFKTIGSTASNVFGVDYQRVVLDQRVVFKIFGALIVLGFLWFLYKKYIATLLTPKFKFYDTAYRPCGGNVTESFLATLPNLVTEFKRVHDTSYTLGWGSSERCNVYSRLAPLSINQIIAFSNAYKNSVKGKTIKTEMKSVSVSGCPFLGSNAYNTLLSKIEKIGLP